MARKRNETDAQWLQRLRDFREDAESGLMMARTRAAVAMINTGHGDTEALKLEAFMAIFHPQYEPLTRAESRDMLSK